MIVEIPKLEEVGGNNGYEIPPITVQPEPGESVVDIGVKFACAVVERYCWSPKDHFLKEKILSKEGIARIRHHLRHTGRIRIRASNLKLQIKKGQLKFNIAHWLHCHPDPDPEKALSFFGRIMKDIAREEATPEETQEIIAQLAKESWVPSKRF